MAHPLTLPTLSVLAVIGTGTGIYLGRAARDRWLRQSGSNSPMLGTPQRMTGKRRAGHATNGVMFSGA